MNSYCEPEFWDRLNSLPKMVRDQANKAFLLWRRDPTHPSVNFKPIPGSRTIWSARVTLNYRALCYKSGKDCNWFFIGNHDDYESQI